MTPLTADSPSAARPRETVVLGREPLTIDDVCALARGTSAPELCDEARVRMQASALVVQQGMADGRTLYGITTGVGASVATPVAPEDSAQLSLNLLRFHGCGTGRLLEEDEAAAVLAVRLSSLMRGLSGVRPLVADRLVALLTERVLPCIPAEGSVGASGDLTPLSYVAAVLVGEREVRYAGKMLPAAEVLSALDLKPLTLGPKEALALMNGTSVASALGCLAWERARRLARLASTLTAMTSVGIRGNPEHFDAFIHAAKPHPGQRAVAAWILEDLGDRAVNHPTPFHVQDRYSIRCAPHILGVLVDALTWSQRIIETEIGGVSDNPIVDPERGRVLHGGNFYGGHVGFALDALKVAIANAADLLDRQLLLLCDSAENGGLPENLVGVPAERASTHHGFKAMSIAASALAAEALKASIPASIFSRSTEHHNQDKVPMATTAARDTLRIVELTEQVAAIATLAACQGLDLRGGPKRDTPLDRLRDAVREHVPMVVEDRRMDHDIQTVLGLMRSDALPLASLELPA